MPEIKRAPKRLIDLDDVSGLLTALVDGYVLTYDHDTGAFTLEPGGSMSGNEILSALSSVDGSGSGLDADYLDGQNSDAFATAAHTHEVDQRSDMFNDSEGDPANIGTAADGASTYAARRNHVHDITASYIRGKGFFDTSNDGSGSGLDADTVDGSHASAFATSGHTHEVDQRADMFSDAEGDPAAVGTAADGTSTYAARRDHVHNFATQEQATVVGRAAAAGTGVPSALTAGQLIDILETADGADSGLDADTLDGSHASDFAASSHTHEVDQLSDIFSDAEGDPAAVGSTADGISSYAARRDHAHDVTAETLRTKGFFDTSNDGAGSGLDADLLDGVHATAFSTTGHTHSTDFGSGGIAADVIAESTPAAGVTVDGLLIKDGAIASGTVAHERGGLEADVSAYNGLVKISGGATSAVTAPSGAIVGTTDTQTLTNKTLTSPQQTYQGLTPGATITWDMSLGMWAHVQLTENATIANPTNVPASTIGFLVLAPNGYSVSSWGANWVWTGGIAPTIGTSEEYLFLIIVRDGNIRIHYLGKSTADGVAHLAQSNVWTGVNDYGATGIKADVIAESTSAAGVTVDGVLLKDGGATVSQLLALAKIGTNVLFVDPKGAGDYTTLSAALADITTASTSNEYLIVVTGEVAETAQVTAKSHVHVLFLAGASVTITSNSNVHGVHFSSVTNSIWEAMDGERASVIRAGAVTSGVHAVNIQSSADATVHLVNILAHNTVTGAAYCHGINVTSSDVALVNCNGRSVDYNGAGGTGIALYNAAPIMIDCEGHGNASGTTGAHGIIMSVQSNPKMIRCRGYGDGLYGSGIYVSVGSSPEMIDCKGYGTTVTSPSGYGLLVDYGATPKIIRGEFYGGSDGNSCRGAHVALGAAPIFIDCVFAGGDGGIDCHGIFVTSSAAPIISGGSFIGGGALPRSASQTVAASTRQEDSWKPTTSAWRLVAININISAAAAGGVTLTMRDATGGGGNALSAAHAVSSTGWVYIPITGNRVISAGNNVYARLSASDSTLAYVAYYVYEICNATCYGIYHDSVAAVTYNNVRSISNANSAAIYVSNNGDDRGKFIGGTAGSGPNDGTRPKAFVCQSSWSPGQVYNMVLDGGSTNLTAAAGTANGSNIEV